MRLDVSEGKGKARTRMGEGEGEGAHGFAPQCVVNNGVIYCHTYHSVVNYGVIFCHTYINGLMYSTLLVAPMAEYALVFLMNVDICLVEKG